jgi:hypothetical protein
MPTPALCFVCGYYRAPGYDADGRLTQCPGCRKSNDWVSDPAALALGVRLRFLRLSGAMSKTEAARVFRSSLVGVRVRPSTAQGRLF